MMYRIKSKVEVLMARRYPSPQDKRAIQQQFRGAVSYLVLFSESVVTGHIGAFSRTGQSDDFTLASPPAIIINAIGQYHVCFSVTGGTRFTGQVVKTSDSTRVGGAISSNTAISNLVFDGLGTNQNMITQGLQTEYGIPY